MDDDGNPTAYRPISVQESLLNVFYRLLLPHIKGDLALNQFGGQKHARSKCLVLAK